MFLFKVYKAARKRRGAHTQPVTTYIVMAPSIEEACRIVLHERGEAGDQFAANAIAGRIATCLTTDQTPSMARNMLALCEYQHPETA